MSPTLRAITDDLLALEAILLDVGGDVTEADVEAAIDQWLAEITGALDKKLDGYVSLIREAEARADVRSSESLRLQDLARLDHAIARRLKDRLLIFMDTAGRTQIHTQYYRLRAVDNGGALPLYIDRPNVPEEYRRVVMHEEVDTAKIKEALAAGIELPFAHYGERGRHVNIR